MQLSATASPPCIALVSVPSIGSKAVQQANAASEQLAVIGFSTLYRVEGCAAQSEPGQHRLDGLFQYPLSGRRLCSELITVREKPRVSGFSTLYRVEGCAAESDAVRVDHPGTFQYPLSGRRLCSTTAIGAASTNSNVSVPSIGSKAVQPARNNVEALQILQFQYPLSGRRLCSRLWFIAQIRHICHVGLIPWFLGHPGGSVLVAGGIIFVRPSSIFANLLLSQIAGHLRRPISWA
ncbi:protein of unknown function [Candidatus Promineifilum breve]|uniref:Uncharacterized protein n=1 Tax=Candidatus Promineifilum breve TaxID=1806508 RepID=A0A160T3H0_9CHLR|nr:protein of unknown function [Candidatus Promineifilum breve]